MSGDSAQPGLCRFQIQRDRDGRHRRSVFNRYGTMVGRHPEGFPTELDARLDAEQLGKDIANAPLVGEVDESAHRV
jgi:hypothetical protein